MPCLRGVFWCASGWEHWYGSGLRPWAPRCCSAREPGRKSYNVYSCLSSLNGAHGVATIQSPSHLLCRHRAGGRRAEAEADPSLNIVCVVTQFCIPGEEISAGRVGSFIEPSEGRQCVIRIINDSGQYR